MNEQKFKEFLRMLDTCFLSRLTIDRSDRVIWLEMVIENGLTIEVLSNPLSPKTEYNKYQQWLSEVKKERGME